jgi:hypothetical protein
VKRGSGTRFGGESERFCTLAGVRGATGFGGSGDSAGASAGGAAGREGGRAHEISRAGPG